MEKTLNIYQKLLVIQSKISGLGKDKKAFNFSYVTGDKLLSYVKPLMDELGLILKQEIISIDNLRMDYVSKSDNKTEILSKVMMRFTWVDSASGETDINLFGANGQNGFDKGVGSALTYGERYFLLKFFHIATDEDDIDNPDLKKSAPIPIEKPTLESACAKIINAKTLTELKQMYDALTSEEKILAEKRKDELKSVLK